MDKPFKYAIYIYTLEVGNLNKIYKNENEISIKICVLQLLKNWQNSNAWCFALNKAEKQTIHNMEHGLDQEYSNLQIMLFFVNLTNCKCIEDSPVVNDLQRHEKYIELEMNKHSCSKVVKIMQRRQKYSVTVTV